MSATTAEGARSSWRRRLVASPLAGPVALAVLLALVSRVWLAVNDHGIIWPDEIYQSVEPATRAVFGYGYQAWEFQDGLRSWLWPGTLAGVLWLGSALGLSTGLSLMVLVKLVLALAATVAAAAAVVLAFRISGTTAAWLAAGTAPLFPVTLALDNHAFTESIAAAMLVGAAAAYEVRRPGSAFLSGALAMGATAVRLQMAPVVVVLFVALVIRRDPRARPFAWGSALALSMAAIVDWFAWGAPLVSYWNNIKFNLLEGKAGLYGQEPVTFFAEHLVLAGGLLGVLVIIGVGLAVRSSPVHVVAVASVVVLHTVLTHKELRFVLPILPYAVGIGAAGWAVQLDRARSTWTPAQGRAFVGGLVIALALAGWWKASTLTFADLGETRFWSAGESPWRNHDGYDRLLSELGTTPGVCGVAIVGDDVIRTGGYSYLHRDVPLWTIDPGAADAAALAAFSAVLVPSNYTLESPWRVLARSGGATAWVRDGSCGPLPPDYDTRFPGEDWSGATRR